MIEIGLPSVSLTESEWSEKLNSFLAKYVDQKVVFITSGGTCVHIDKVRKIENISTGQRGSHLAEYFLLKGYVVIFLYRKNSKIPFLEELNLFDNEIKSKIDNMLASHSKYKAKLFFQYFETYDDYHKLVFNIIQSMLSFKFLYKPLIVLAAAVSDFQIGNHFFKKLDFSDGSFKLDLATTPKIALSVAKMINTECNLVTFKLEISLNEVIRKGLLSFSTLKPSVCIGNVLENKDHQVFFITKNKNWKSNEIYSSEVSKLKNDHCSFKPVTIEKMAEHHCHYFQSVFSNSSESFNIADIICVEKRKKNDSHIESSIVDFLDNFL